MSFDETLVKTEFARAYQQLRTRTLQIKSTVEQLVTDANKFIAKADLAKQNGFLDESFDPELQKVSMLVNAPQVQELLTLINENITDPLAG